MIKYLLLVCLIAAPFAQTPEAVVTHYDLEGNLIQEESSLQGSEDIDSMNSMNMNQQDLDSSSMDLIRTDSMDYSTPETESVESSNIESSMNQETTVSNMNIDPNSMYEEDSMMINNNIDNSMPEQDSMYSTSDPNDISAIEPSEQNMEDAIESTQVSNVEEVNSEVIHETENNNIIAESNEIENNNMIAQSNEINNIDPNNVEIPQDNQVDVSNILESNVEFSIDNNISNQNEVDPNMAFDVITNTESLQSSPDMENGFVQSEVNADKAQAKKISDTEKVQGDQKEEHNEQKTEETQSQISNNNNNQSQEHQTIIQDNNDAASHENLDSLTQNNNVNAVGQENANNIDADQQLQQSESKTIQQLVQGDCIIIYSQCNFKGEALEACNSLSEIEEFKAQIRSIYIPEGLGLTVYDGENFTGNMHKFKSSQECLATPLSFAQLNNPGNQLKGQNLRSRQ
ncbi:unnamed protein product [Paramecium pentaurelia]|uniref:Uncharacterized protein n=1 Tax=Paramecium pentaurelia TaxID=43138 RepID=A0A8S1WHJ3_9CILI|nr:unnamed protein product [Paramecium pentaurelia]